MWYKRDEQAMIIGAFYSMYVSLNAICVAVAYVYAIGTVSNNVSVVSSHMVLLKYKEQPSRTGRSYSPFSVVPPLCGACLSFGGFPIHLCGPSAGLRKTVS